MARLTVILRMGGQRPRVRYMSECGCGVDCWDAASLLHSTLCVMRWSIATASFTFKVLASLMRTLNANGIAIVRQRRGAVNCSACRKIDNVPQLEIIRVQIGTPPELWRPLGLASKLSVSPCRGHSVGGELLAALSAWLTSDTGLHKQKV